MKKTVVLITIAAFAITISAGILMAQDDLQEAKSSFLGAGVKFNMDKPSMRATNQSSREDKKEAYNYDSMKSGLLNDVIGGGEGGNGRGQGIRSKPIKDTKLLCEVCKAKAVIHANESCEYCKGQPYASLCDKCIAWSILNSCDECKGKISGAKTEKKAPEKKAEEEVTSEEKAAGEEALKEEKKAEEITADDEPVAREKKGKKAKKEKKAKKVKKEKKNEEAKEETPKEEVL